MLDFLLTIILIVLIGNTITLISLSRAMMTNFKMSNEALHTLLVSSQMSKREENQKPKNSIDYRAIIDAMRDYSTARDPSLKEEINDINQ